MEYVPASNKNVTVRGGGYYDPSPVPAEHLTPTSPDSTRIAVTAGASYRITPAWAADLFAEQMWLMRRDTTSVDTMPASYGGTAMVVGAGIRWSR
jgi:long-subunit fatty acid transport protein